VRGPARDRLAVEGDAAGRRGREAGDDVEERRLAGAVGPDEAVDPARPQPQAHVPQRLEAPKHLSDAPQLKHRGPALTAQPGDRVGYHARRSMRPRICPNSQRVKWLRVTRQGHAPVPDQGLSAGAAVACLVYSEPWS
jgi:hypothetical protein